MPTITVSELIDRAKIAADMENTNFVSPAGWLYFLNTEYKNLYTRVARMGFPLNSTSVTVVATGAASYTITAPAAVVSVRGASSSSTGRLYRIPIKSEVSQKYISNIPTGNPREVIITRSADNLTLSFYPNPTSGNFYVKTVPYPDKLVLATPAAGENDDIVIPLGWEERIVLGAARRALSKEETTNSAIEREIAEMDNIIENSAFSYILSEFGTVIDMAEIDTADYSAALWFWV